MPSTALNSIESELAIASYTRQTAKNKDALQCHVYRLWVNRRRKQVSDLLMIVCS